jgi:membrane protease YdiL (CAAX protease family)
MSLADVAVSAVLQAAVIGGIPLVVYLAYQRLRHKRTLREGLQRSGLQIGDPRYLIHSSAFALFGVCVLVTVFAVWPGTVELFTREGSAQRPFVGLGLGPTAIAMASLHGLVQTGFVEELLFRGLIAGSLSRHLPLIWANVIQASIFLLPHFLILLVMPEMWLVLPLVFLGALMFGWVRIKSGSMLGPWLMHGAGNVTMALIVAARTSTI